MIHILHILINAWCCQSFPILAIMWIFNFGYLLVSCCGFNLHFPGDKWDREPFSILFCLLYIFLCEMSVQVFCSLSGLSFHYWFVGVLYIFWEESFIRYVSLEYFIPFCGFSPHCLYKFFLKNFFVDVQYYVGLRYTTQ